MAKFVNFRSFVYSALMLILTSIFCVIACNVDWLGVILLNILLFVPFVTAIAIRKKIKTYIFVTIITTSILCLISMISFFIAFDNWLPYNFNKEYIVKGTYDDSYDNGNFKFIFLKDVTLNGKNMPGKILVEISGDVSDSGITYGDELKFFSKVEGYDLIEDFEVNAAEYKENVRYFASVDINDITIAHYEPSIWDKLEKNVKDLLFEEMGDKYGAVAYAMLTGDKNNISNYYKSVFSLAGIAHILAVSGLHIGFLMGVVTFLLRKCKIKKLPTFIIDIVFLLLYMIVADFSPSVVRASIMFAVGGGAMLIGEQNDSFNSLGLSMTIILTFSPIMLFDVGFILSVGAVFGIIVFEPIFERALLKIRMPSFAAKAISVPLSAQIGIMPPSIYFFSSFSLWAVPVNILLMPLMAFSFVFVFIALFLSLILNLKLLLKLAAIPIRGLLIGAEYLSMAPLAYINVKPTRWIFAAFPLYFTMSSFVNIKYKKVIASIAVSALSIGVFVLILLA